MKLRNLPDKLKPFAAHGVTLTPGDPKATGDCPFCGKEGHFGIETTTGKWRCVRCDEKGNVATFLQLLHETSMARVVDAAMPYYASLCEARPGITPDLCKEWGICRSFITDDWLIPAYNVKGKLANLSRAVVQEGKWVVMSTPGCKQHPFGTLTLTKEHTALWVCEGPWDGLALSAALRTIARRGDKLVRTTDVGKSLSTIEGVISVPGAGGFNPEWVHHFHKRHVYLAYDNDHPQRTPAGKIIKPGWDGYQRVVDAVAQSQRQPRTLHRLKWGRGGFDKSLANGYDVRDLLNDRGAVAAYRLLHERSEGVEFTAPTSDSNKRQQITPIECTTFDDLMGVYHSRLYITDAIRSTLAVMLASVVSTDLKSDQLWLRIIGPPGSCKSTLAEAISASVEHTFPVSLQTGFHSGYTGSNRNGNSGKDSSLIPEIDHRTVIIKDADTLLTSPSRDRILAELRDIYDGTSRARYRNRKANNYENLRTTFILCGTDELRQLDSSSLGERFLNAEIYDNGDRRPFLNRAAEDAYRDITSGFAAPDDAPSEPEADDTLKAATVGYIDYLKAALRTTPAPVLSDANRQRIEALGELIAYMRAQVKRDKEGLLHRPRVELATRLVKQLMKLAVTTAYVLNKPAVDEPVMAIVRKVACDTCYGFTYEITQLIHRFEEEGGITAKRIELTLNIGEGTVRRLLNDMRELGIVCVHTKPNLTGQRGNQMHLWRLTPVLQSLYEEALVSAKQPTPHPIETPHGRKERRQHTSPPPPPPTPLRPRPVRSCKR